MADYQNAVVDSTRSKQQEAELDMRHLDDQHQHAGEISTYPNYVNQDQGQQQQENVEGGSEFPLTEMSHGNVMYLGGLTDQDQDHPVPETVLRPTDHDVEIGWQVPAATATKATIRRKRTMLYEIEDIPPWYLTIFLAFQHYLLMAGATLSLPLLLLPAMCMQNDDPDQGNIISTFLFVAGIITILQSTFGTRLPIVQGGSFAFIIPALVVLKSSRWQCPAQEEIDNMSGPKKTELWQVRMREISGAIIVASLLQIGLGLFGVFGLIYKRVTPITMASAVITIGLSLFADGSRLAATSWYISILTILLVIIFSQYLRNLKIPIPFTRSTKRSNKMLRYPLFQVFPVLLTIIIVWVICSIVTLFDGFPESQVQARTDYKWDIVRKSQWFRVPFPFQWGFPTVTFGVVIGFLSSVFAGIVESLGEYHACARIVGAPKPPAHAINRGIFVEGLGCMLTGMFGTGNGTTSYSGNTGAMNVTKVGSRRVIQTAGCIMMICSLFSFLGAFFVSIPEPIIGGILCVTFSVITAVGLSNLHNVDLTSSRNIFIVGFSVYFGLAVSKWMADSTNKGKIDVGVQEINYAIEILLSTGMFISGLCGFILDNTVPGTDEERGVLSQSQVSPSSDGGDEADEDVTYDLPFGMEFLKLYEWTELIPILPTFQSRRSK